MSSTALRSDRPFLFALTLALSLSAVASQARSAPHEPAGQTDQALPTMERFVARVYYTEPSEIGALAEFDLLELNNREERYVLVAVDPADYAAIESLGFRVSVDAAGTADLALAGAVAGATGVAGIPGFPCYRTVEETFAVAEQIAVENPTLASWVDVGDSWEKQQGIGGYDMRVLRMTHSAVSGPKPKMIATCSIHARELTPAGLCARFADYLAKNYSRSAEVTWLLDHHEIHLMLQANPDGRKMAESGLSWRKNTNQAYCSPTSNSRGADLNRNFEFEWGCCNGASNSQCNSLYRGPAPASEPEVQAVQSYLLQEFPDQRADPLGSPAPIDASGVYLDIHSYSQLVLWPWGFDLPAPNAAELARLGRKFSYFNGYAPQQAVDLYVTDGTTIDFAYGNLGVAAYVFELGTAFFQGCPEFELEILPDNLQAMLYAAKVARAPYLAPAGPDVMAVVATPLVAEAGTSLDLHADVDDTRTGSSIEPIEDVVAAEYYVDTPPWDGSGGAVAVPMSPSDGAFDGSVEEVTALVPTAGLANGRHIVFVRGQDAAGNWGPFSATFFHVGELDADGDGAGASSDCAPTNWNLWLAPSSASDLALAKQPVGHATWSPPADPGGNIWSYDLLRSTSPADFTAATCVASDLIETSATAAGEPAAGELWSYLVRVRNACGSNLGTDSSGMPRAAGSCP